MTASLQTPSIDPRDLQAGLAGIKRDSIVNRHGVSYKEFRHALTPRFAVLWARLLSGHAALAATTIALSFMYRRWPSQAPAVVVVGGVAYGYALAYILLFFHEAAHYNLAPDRTLNDRLANAFIGIFIGQRIETYRPVHFDHHRHLGTPLDSERTYLDELNPRFMLELLTGIKVIKGLIRRDTIARPPPGAGGHAAPGFRAQLALGAFLNAAVLASAGGLGLWPLAVAWLIGLAIVFPFLAAIRQLLEHRGEHASRAVDYSVVPHGPVNRMFGSGLLASTFGGAGFNRHLLHHWEPQISCTRLRDLEDFLLDTSAAEAVADRRSSYVRTFARLFRTASGK